MIHQESELTESRNRKKAICNGSRWALFHAARLPTATISKSASHCIIEKRPAER